MHIKEIEIRNFRGIDLHIEDLSKEILVIGKNDSGKTNFLYAIRKVLDIKTRRIPLLDSDSTDGNKKDITIKMVLDVNTLEDNDVSLIRKYLDQDQDKRYLYISLDAVYDNDNNVYNETLIFGERDKIEKNITNSNELDNLLSILYIPPGFDLSEDNSLFFAEFKRRNEKNNIIIGKDVETSLDKLNDAIINDNAIKTIKDQFSIFSDFENIFDGVSFTIESNIEPANYYKSLTVKPMENELPAYNIGDGKSKTLSLLLRSLTTDSSKAVIVLLEEPENHLYPLLQKELMAGIEKLTSVQTIVTTHSPFVLHFKRDTLVIKLLFDKRSHIYNFFRMDYKQKEIESTYGYLFTDDFTEAIYYDNVLLVEGYSERVFFDYCFRNFPKFQSKLFAKRMTILPVYGVDFNPSYRYLKSFGINVAVITDNDKYPVRGDKNFYAGIERCLDLLDENVKSTILSKYSIKNTSVKIGSDDENNIVKNMANIRDDLAAYNIFLQEDDFEDILADMMGYSGDEKIAFISNLDKSKMKQLNEFLINNGKDIDLSKWEMLNKFLK